MSCVSRISTYGGEIGAEKSLFDARPKSQGNDEDLVGFLHVLESGEEQLHAALTVLTLIFTVPEFEKKNEQ